MELEALQRKISKEGAETLIKSFLSLSGENDKNEVSSKNLCLSDAVKELLFDAKGNLDVEAVRALA